MLRRVLEEADDATLVLLDEIGSGTDPAEGAALAAADAGIADANADPLRSPPPTSGSLKDLAGHTPGIINASLQFDAVSLTPTYRFLKGVPGSALTGSPLRGGWAYRAEILADAEARVPDAERSLDALLAAVEERERELRSAQANSGRSARLTWNRCPLAWRLRTRSQRAREAELKRKEKEAERVGPAAGPRLSAGSAGTGGGSAGRGSWCSGRGGSAGSAQAGGGWGEGVRRGGSGAAGQRGSGARWQRS